MESYRIDDAQILSCSAREHEFEGEYEFWLKKDRLKLSLSNLKLVYVQEYFSPFKLFLYIAAHKGKMKQRSLEVTGVCEVLAKWPGFMCAMYV